MNTMIQSSLRSKQAPTPFQDGHLSARANFIVQSASYLGLKLSRDDVAVVLTHKDIDASAFQTGG